MQSRSKLQLLAILLINCANLHQTEGQADNFQLKLGEINTEEVQLNPINDNQYQLIITLPESRRDETISLEPNDEGSGPVVVTSGQIDTNFPDQNVNSVVTYVADRNGYRASYRIGKGINDAVGISFGSRLNIRDLMSLTG